MNDQLGKAAESVKSFWNGLSSKVKKLMIAAAIAIAVIAALAAILLNTGRAEFTELYSSVSSDEAAQIMKKLDEMGAEYKLENGKIMIPKSSEAKLKMMLSMDGHPYNGSSYDVLNKNIDMMTTEYEKKKYWILQLQANLESSINTIDGIKSSKVLITIPDTRQFAWEDNPEESKASVVLTLIDGKALSGNTIKGIANLVCKSVSGLTEDNVAIMDDKGNHLYAGNDDFGNDAITARMEKEREYEAFVENKLRGMLEKIYGAGNVELKANCVLNMDKIVSQQTEYTPEVDKNTGVIKEENNSTSATGSGTVSGGVAGAETNAEASVYPNVNINDDEINYQNRSDRKYSVDETKRQTEHQYGYVEDLSISVIINKANAGETEATDISDLIINSSMAKPEDISVKFIKFFDKEPLSDDVGTGTTPNTLDTRTLIIIGVAALAVLLIVLILTILLLRKRKKKKAQAEAEAALTAEPKEVWDEINEPIEVAETKEAVLKKQIQEFTVNNPEIAAQLVRTWLKGDDGD